ncbi:MAG: HPF/RaiA family ribosome-associated protein [Deltaproteobacteria bacterium]|nr:HPF/RaiA family ribosome-associated protein [Deltaproteobacteria bacterium]
MNIPIKITFRNMPPSEAIESSIRDKAVKLDTFYEKIMSCRVMLEAPHRYHRKGKVFRVRIDMTVPGGELVVNRAPKRIIGTPLHRLKEPDADLAVDRQPSKPDAHEDIYVAIRDAFDAARRKLQDYARRQRGQLKIHEPMAHARVSKLLSNEGFGFLETADGREIYFHENSVLNEDFDRMKENMEVQFTEEQGEKGPQASSVRVIGKHHG